MEIGLFVRSLLIGFSIAAVVGPIGLLCIQRTLHTGFRSGLMTGLGAATADAIYSSVAGFGLTIITTLLIAQISWIHVLGGIALIYLGSKTALTRPAEYAASGRASNLLTIYFSTLLLTLTNPLTILSFVAIFASIGVGAGKNGTFVAFLVVSGVFVGSTLWWCLLTGGVSLLRRRLERRWFAWINRFSGCIILIFGFLAILSLKR